MPKLMVQIREENDTMRDVIKDARSIARKNDKILISPQYPWVIARNGDVYSQNTPVFASVMFVMEKSRHRQDKTVYRQGLRAWRETNEKRAKFKDMSYSSVARVLNQMREVTDTIKATTH